MRYKTRAKPWFLSIVQEAGWAPGPVWTGTVHTSKVKVKVQFTLKYAMKAQRGTRGTVLFFI